MLAEGVGRGLEVGAATDAAKNLPIRPNRELIKSSIFNGGTRELLRLQIEGND